MISGIGTDICAVQRIQDILSDPIKAERFLDRLFTQKEKSSPSFKAHDAHFIARRFAAKEAVAKALGTGIGEKLSFQDFYIEREGNTPPTVIFEKSDWENVQIHLSISDEKEYAVAFAVCLKTNV